MVDSGNNSRPQTTQLWPLIFATHSSSEEETAADRPCDRNVSAGIRVSSNGHQPLGDGVCEENDSH